MEAVLTVIVAASSLWVYFDARSIGVKKGQLKGIADLSPLGWLIACLLLWIIAFPMYLAKRPYFQHSNTSKQSSMGATCRTLYDVLSVASTATSKEIEEQALKFGSQYRPDQNPDNQEAARRFDEIERAYEILKNPESRANYDAKLSLNTPSRTTTDDQSFLGIVACGFGGASLLLPYFAAVFFAPVAIILGVASARRKGGTVAYLGIALGAIGVISMIYTSSQITKILRDGDTDAGRTSLYQSPLSPTPVVTHAEYYRIAEGMSYTEVKYIIGAPGEELSRSNFTGIVTVMYSWTNSNGSNMNAIFQNDQLVNKAQFGLP